MIERDKELVKQENEIISYLNKGMLEKARDAVIRLLDFQNKNNTPQNNVTNYFIRQVGLYQYLNHNKLTWKERVITKSFSANLGQNIHKTLHQGQSIVLKNY